MARIRKEIEEGLDMSDDSYDVYEPQNEEGDLEVEEGAYNVLEYISLDWPAQSIDVMRGYTVMLGTNPAPGEGKPGMISIDLFPTHGMSKPDKMVITKKKVSESYNKVRVNGESTYCLSDDTLVVHGPKFEVIHTKRYDEGLGYGLCFNGSGCVLGTRDGKISMNDWRFNETGTVKVHEGSIEGICSDGSMIYSGGCDYAVVFFDVRGKDAVFRRKFSSDINAIGFNGDNTLAFGDDEGTVWLMDIRNHEVEKITRHKSPVSCLRWRDGEIFVSGSDEQLCIWDVSLDASEEDGYLLFVHQGQKFYKDVAFCRGDSNFVITTSADGLCVFNPISFDCEKEMNGDA
ncbi:hypothetical protein OCOL_000613 [Ordospora colligata]|uniref:WD G-beta repeat domain-containing protein n=1 Tax=Ordospora colligata OC4 TaxID=1354746 RepID=A0A0B2UN50_9MICR|nr:WD G-beta repeat domain-containing protein [Ordospora colligata OC4]KHN70497.1 WD G-beta repeat domain-containing protein [Ordospora colligata OC4]TBU17247.1 WD G-beta repeat domain-containing protein [Ordospora colligata]TBU17497.1 WD G-beta repeat domain-containing protein [Ordospora colligata]